MRAGSLLRNRRFALVWWGGLLSLTGHATLGVALSAYVYIATGSALATSLMFVANQLPRLLLSPVAGVMVDRWSRRKTLIVSNLLLATGCLPLLAVDAIGAHWLIYLVFAVQSSVFRFFEPAETALLPRLVAREELPGANALNALNNNLGRLAGPSLGGLLVATTGLGGVAFANLALYLVAALLVSRVVLDERAELDERVALDERAAPDERAEPDEAQLIDAEPADDARARRGLAGIWVDLISELSAGLRLVASRRILRLMVVLLCLTAVGEGVFSVLITPFTLDVLGVGPLELGWLRSVQGVGGIAGGVLIATVASRLAPAVMLGIGGILFGLIDLAIFNYPRVLDGFAPALVLMVLVGVPAAAFGAGLTTLLQANVPDRLLGRVHGVISALAGLCALLGIALAGALADSVGIVPVLNLQGYVYVAAGAVFYLVLRRSGWTVPETPDRQS